MPYLRRWLFGLGVGLALHVAATPTWSQPSSGGYTRPSAGYTAPARRPSAGGGALGYGGGSSFGSAADRALSRRAGEQSLSNYRADLRTLQEPPRRSPAWNEGGYPAAPLRRPPTYGEPSTGLSSAWNVATAWALLSALNAPSREAYFQTYRDDPGYRAWRQQAQLAAQHDPTVAANLRSLDQQMAQAPARVSPERGDAGFVLIVVLLGGIVLVLFWMRRRRSPAAVVAPPGPSPFRIGMVIPADPTPFLLAGNTTKIHPPEGGGALSVEAVGLLQAGNIVLHRLYLPGGPFFQVHVGAGSTPDECRYFSQIDEVAPASSQEWAFWLDPAEGTIGWPAFQTKDGKTYGRVWSQGSTRIQPIAFDETITRTTGVVRRRHQAMLYGAATGGAPPAPSTEYVLVAAVEESGGAYVAIHAGIDINPAALDLAPVPLTEQRSAA